MIESAFSRVTARVPPVLIVASPSMAPGNMYLAPSWPQNLSPALVAEGVKVTLLGVLDLTSTVFLPTLKSLLSRSGQRASETRAQASPRQAAERERESHRGKGCSVRRTGAELANVLERDGHVCSLSAHAGGVLASAQSIRCAGGQGSAPQAAEACGLAHFYLGQRSFGEFDETKSGKKYHE